MNKLAVSLLGLLLVSSAHASVKCPTYREAMKLWDDDYFNWYYDSRGKRCWGVKPKSAPTPKPTPRVYLPVVPLEPEIISRWPDPEPESARGPIYTTFDGPEPDVWPDPKEFKQPWWDFWLLAMFLGLFYMIGDLIFGMKQMGRIT